MKTIENSTDLPAPDGSSRPGPLLRFDVPSATEQTVAQIGCLLRVVEEVGAFTVENNDPVEGSENNEEVAAKAADTVVHALRQLDNIIDDMSRWSVRPSATEAAHVDFLTASVKTQEIVAREARRPFRRMGAEVGQLKDGSGWVARLQQEGLHPLMAAGRTPEAAMRAFDRLIEEGWETYDLLTQTPHFSGIPKRVSAKKKKTTGPAS